MNAGADPHLPGWIREVIALYESHAANQFLFHGNVNDSFVAAGRNGGPCGLADYLERVLFPGFDVVLRYDLAHGLRVQKGGPVFQQWPSSQEGGALPRAPRAAMELLAHYFRYLANLRSLKHRVPAVGCLLNDVQYILPATQGAPTVEAASMGLLVREWAVDPTLGTMPLAVCLIAENIHDLHPMVAGNPRLARVEVPLPDSDGIAHWLRGTGSQYDTALGTYKSEVAPLAAQFAGSSLVAIENFLKRKEYDGKPIEPSDLVSIKKQLVEREAQDLIEFIEPRRTLDDYLAQEALIQWLRDDIALWRKGETEAMPMGYLLCGPVGTGKTFLVECLAGEAGVPVVKIKNFRDKWIGSTEGNLEKIFRLLHGLGRCLVFIDEADQTLGKRDAGQSDSGLSGRIYSMFAKEMSESSNRGRIVWVLASSRPDLIEVDLKRPGRVDVKIPIFPTTTAEESFALVRALANRRGLALEERDYATVHGWMPRFMTPGAAETLAVKLYRDTRVHGTPVVEALRKALMDYQHPVPWEVMRFQIGLAVHESSDMDFVPPLFRDPETLTGYH